MPAAVRRDVAPSVGHVQAPSTPIGSPVHIATRIAKPIIEKKKQNGQEVNLLNLGGSFAPCKDEGCVDASCVEGAINVEMQIIDGTLQKEAEADKDDGPPPLVYYPPGWRRGDDPPPLEDDSDDDGGPPPLVSPTTSTFAATLDTLQHDVPDRPPRRHQDSGVNRDNDDDNGDNDGKKEHRSRQAMALGMC